MMLTHKQIREGDLIPRFYGVAYEDLLERVTICYLFPFNILIGLARKYWQKVRYYHVENPLEKQAMLALAAREVKLLDQGYKYGYHEGQQLSLDKMSDELNKARQAGARDMMNAMNKEAGLEPLPDDWDAYKGE